jgi:LmbE family N-acetylglucosaminyl deacetylase
MLTKPRKTKVKIVLYAAAVIIALAIVALFVYYTVWRSNFSPIEDSYFHSPLISDKNVLVIVPHPDDEVNLAFGVVDSLVHAGSKVTIAYATNGDKQISGYIRVAEAVKADSLMGVPKDNLVLLGYGDYMVPPFFCLDPEKMQESPAGYTHTYGCDGISDYHTVYFGEPSPYTGAAFENDIYTLILELKPDLILASDTDYHIDHVSLSQSFDRVMGRILRDHPDYRPVVFKGYCYEYAWYANDDFYNFLTLQSALAQWNKAGYNTAFPWSERVRFPLPAEYLGYTLRSSKLHTLLAAFESQNAVSREGRLLNGDKLFWERRTDALLADVTASSGNAALLQDFLLGDTMEAPLKNCWMPDSGDTDPSITFSWVSPKPVAELVFYDAPPPAGDILSVEISDDSGHSMTYDLPNSDGMPCRLAWNGTPAKRLTVRVLKSQGEPIGFSEIEILPERSLQTQWIHLMDPELNFIYEYPYPADQPMELLLYGYPRTPAHATAVIAKEGSGETVAEVEFNGHAFAIPPLKAGKYRILATADGCSVEAVLRIGDSMLTERADRWIERMLPDFIKH